MPRAVGLIVASATIGMLGGCSSAAATVPSGRPVIAAAFYPVEEIVRAIGGSSFDVITIVPPGEEAHEYEPTARQAGNLQRASFVFYLGGGFQPNVEKAIGALPDTVRKVDLLKSIDLLPIEPKLAGTEGQAEGEVLASGDDPHVWLDPNNMITMTKTVAGALGVDPSRYIAELSALDGEFRSGLAHCNSNVIVTSHRAFGYLAHAYGLTQIPIAGISPTEEPSAKTLEAVAKAAKAAKAKTIFFEQNLPADLAKTVADEVGATTAVLDPVESPSSDLLKTGATYISIMRADLATLRSGLGCS